MFLLSNKCHEFKSNPHKNETNYCHYLLVKAIIMEQMIGFKTYCIYKKNV